MDEYNIYDNQIECAHCGEHFSFELTRCPACGVSVYPDGEVDDELRGDRISNLFDVIGTPLYNFLVALVAWVSAVCLSLVIYIPLRRVFTSKPSDFVLQILITLAVVVGAFASGYFSARFARIRRLELGIVVGALCAFITIPLLGRDFQNLWSAVLSPVTIFGWGAVVLSGYGGAWLATEHVREKMTSELFQYVKSESQLYQDLISRVGHDQAIAERLIEYERRRAPKSSRSDLIRLAIERWDRDNRGIYKSGINN
jgi:hypothetical protein